MGDVVVLAGAGLGAYLGWLLVRDPRNLDKISARLTTKKYARQGAVHGGEYWLFVRVLGGMLAVMSSLAALALVRKML